MVANLTHTYTSLHRRVCRGRSRGSPRRIQTSPAPPAPALEAASPAIQAPKSNTNIGTSTMAITLTAAMTPLMTLPKTRQMHSGAARQQWCCRGARARIAWKFLSQVRVCVCHVLYWVVIVVLGLISSVLHVRRILFYGSAILAFASLSGITMRDTHTYPHPTFRWTK